MPTSWNFGKECPRTVDDLRIAMTKTIERKKGKALISEKFTKDHIYSGHEDSTTKLAIRLMKQRNIPQSTLLISSLEPSAHNEVKNWIKKIDSNAFTLIDNTWTINNINSDVPMMQSYKFATVDREKLKEMNKDDLDKKSRNYIKISTKTPRLACQFSKDGVPQIYHLNY